MNRDLVEKHQQQILTSIFDGKDVSDTELVIGILPYARTEKSEYFDKHIGELGVKIRDFAAAIDLTHPDLKVFRQGLLAGWSEASFGRNLYHVIRLVELGQDLNASKAILDAIKGTLNQNEVSILLKCIDDPAKNQLHVRFVPEAGERTRIRGKKKQQVVGLGMLYGEGQKLWDSHASGFENYHRHNLYQKDIADAEQKKKTMLVSGLSSIAKEMDWAIQELKDKSHKDTYHGFCKITLVTASVILAKMMGYEYSDDVRSLGYGWSSCATDKMIFVRPSKFKYQFYDDAPKEVGSIWNDRLEYYPRLYPLHEVSGRMSDDCIKVVNYLEECPDVGGKAMFDHYKVLIPTVNYPSLSQLQPHFKLPSGESVVFDDVSSAQRCLDVTLLDQKEIVGVLLGERDGEHYFLCYVN